MVWYQKYADWEKKYNSDSGILKKKQQKVNFMKAKHGRSVPNNHKKVIKSTDNTG